MHKPRDRAGARGGEIKTRAAEFDDKQLTRDIALSKRLRVDVHVLAAIDTVSADLEADARKRCELEGFELLVLDECQLRPNVEETQVRT